MLWIDTANYAGPVAKIPKELQSTEVTQNSQSVNQTIDTDSDEVKLDMNWNIAEQLPEDRNCRAELEAVLKLFMDALINTNSLSEAIDTLPMYAYEIVQRLHKDFAPGKVSPATQFANALIEVLNTINDVDNEASKLLNKHFNEHHNHSDCNYYINRSKHYGGICYVWLVWASLVT